MSKRSQASRPRRRSRRGFLRDERGVAAVEFALVVPFFALILAATVDFGIELYLREQLDDSVSAAANYALVNSQQVNSSNAASLGSTLASLVANTHGSNWASSTVTVNAGPTATSGGSSSGTASAADSCYCPTGGASSLTWGATQTCGATCPSGAVAGKFVLVTASASYSPLFPRFGLASNGQLSSASLVQVQ
jgi:Flp pilus assembly protein TadG